jgi:unsaturated chondroitin disaccharide hydrolase
MHVRPLARAATLAACFLAAACAPPASPRPRAQPRTALDSAALATLEFAAARYAQAAAAHDPAAGYPRATKPDGTWNAVPMNDWTSGFFPGTLWYLYEQTRDPALRTQAERWTLPLADIPKGRYTHDLGFQFFSSFAKAYRLTGEERFRAPALNAAGLLAGRYNPTVGAIKSWDWTDPKRPYPVIVDNMMNLELLFWGAKHGGRAEWTQMAKQHALTTLANHVRADGGSFHVVVFDPATGAALERITHQGYADSTTWARGQAWLIYGFSTAFRETRDARYLAAGRRVADYAIPRLPADHVPCWDFQAPGCPDAPRDASAAAVTASGLLELSTFVPGADGARYRRTAEEILASLTSPAYLARDARTEAVLLHSVGNKPAGTEIDVGISYGDYYFVEALMRYLELRGMRAP